MLEEACWEAARKAAKELSLQGIKARGKEGVSQSRRGKER